MATTDDEITVGNYLLARLAQLNVTVNAIANAVHDAYAD